MNICQFDQRLLPLALLLGGLMAAPVMAQDGPPPVPVAVDEVVQDSVAATIWVPGTIISRNDAEIAAEAPGRIVWVAEVGDQVESGRAIARVDDTDLKLELRDAEARIDSLNAQARYQRTNLERLQRLSTNNSVAVNQIDEAVSQLDVTESEIRRAEVARDQIHRRIEKSAVMAPFSGRLVSRLVEVGEFVSLGQAVARLVDIEQREIRVQAPLTAAPFVREDSRLSVTHPQADGDTTVRTIVPVGDERSRMFEIRLAADAPEWIIGSAVRVALPTSQARELVSVSRDALVMRGDEMFVYRVTEDGGIERVDVQTGIGVGDRVEVVGDLYDGDRLIVRGAERLQPGQTVQVLDGIAGTSGDAG